MKFYHIATVAMISAVSASRSNRLIVEATTTDKSTTKPTGDDKTKMDGSTKEKEDGGLFDLKKLFGGTKNAVTIGASLTTSVALTTALYM